MISQAFLVLHGPNLNLLGTRERAVYGSHTLASINRQIAEWAVAHRCKVKTFQSNVEGELINAIHASMKWSDGLIINAGGYTHTSVALRDAIKASALPTVEVHLTNVAGRETFRHTSLITPVSIGIICGFGPDSYHLALNALNRYIQKKRQGSKKYPNR